MLNFLGWLFAGLIVGALARLLVPGRQSMGILMTMVLGIFGALVGGGISYLIWGMPGEPFAAHAWPGYLFSILGAVIVLLLAGAANSSRTRSYF